MGRFQETSSVNAVVHRVDCGWPLRLGMTSTP